MFFPIIQSIICNTLKETVRKFAVYRKEPPGCKGSHGNLSERYSGVQLIIAVCRVKASEIPNIIYSVN